MIILDTNVIAAFMREQQDAALINWLHKTPPHYLRQTAINRYEIERGVEAMTNTRMAAELRKSYNSFCDVFLIYDDLPFTPSAATVAAEVYGRLDPQRRAELGNDILIAAIALIEQAPVATGDGADFRALGVDIINPWA